MSPAIERKKAFARGCPMRALGVDAVHQLQVHQLAGLATDLRDLVKAIVRDQGGHYSSPLGVVELAVALHYAFWRPGDKIIWDTGHQCYAHKLLTGRFDDFVRLRTRRGAAGFPRREESAHDPFGTGHSSTAIAAAIGFAHSAHARDADSWAVAVIGDGALASGPALEALVLASETPGRLCVVLNDNGYAISGAVGALAGNPGSSYRSLADAVGLDYVGPVDGHSITALLDALQRVTSRRHVFVHVRTRKGFGDSAAESDPVGYYSLPSSGAAKGSRETLQSGLGKILVRMAEEGHIDKVITAAMAVGGSLLEFQHRFPDKFLDVGIAEATAVTVGAALAADKAKVLVHLYSTFLQRGVDQIIHDVGLQKLPVIFAVDRVGFSGEDGPTHHGVYDLSFLTAVPNAVVFSVADLSTLESVLSGPVNVCGPTFVRFSKDAGVQWRHSARSRSPGVPSLLIRRRGEALTVLTHGRVARNIDVAADLMPAGSAGIRIVEVVRLHPPISAQDLRDVVLPGRPVVVIEESVNSGSLGARIATLASQDASIGEVHHLCVTAPAAAHGDLRAQWRDNQLDVESIARTLCALSEASRAP